MMIESMAYCWPLLYWRPRKLLVCPFTFHVSGFHLIFLHEEQAAAYFHSTTGVAIPCIYHSPVE